LGTADSRLDYRFGYKRKTISLGSYPDVSLARARENRDEVLGVRVDLIEHQLAHAVRDPLGRAYNRTAHLAERRKMMQKWADDCDGLKAGAEVVSLRDRCRRD